MREPGNSTCSFSTPHPTISLANSLPSLPTERVSPLSDGTQALHLPDSILLLLCLLGRLSPQPGHWVLKFLVLHPRPFSSLPRSSHSCLQRQSLPLLWGFPNLFSNIDISPSSRLVSPKAYLVSLLGYFKGIWNFPLFWYWNPHVVRAQLKGLHFPAPLAARDGPWEVSSGN